MADKPEIEVTEGSDNVFLDLGFPAEEAARMLADAEAEGERQRGLDALPWSAPEIEEDVGDITIRAFTLDKSRALGIVVKRNSVLVVDTGLKGETKIAPTKRFEHNAFRPAGDRPPEDTISPLIQAVAVAIATADGYDPYAHWFDADRWGNDIGGPCWTFYTDHAKQAVKAIRLHDVEHPPRRAD